MPTCAFLPCDQVKKCCLPGGCITKRFGRSGVSASSKETMRKDQPALNGTKPGITGRKPKPT